MFSHIYMEKNIKDNSTVKNIIDMVSGDKIPEIIFIGHYKDVFCRKKQSFAVQKASPALILAKKTGQLLYEGSPVCQSFGNEHFYYTSLIMNCLYDCEYCYLRGMYPSGNIVVFINTEDYFSEVEGLLKKHPVYLSISYDTDLMALNPLTGILNKWLEFTDRTENLSIEIRTKCGNVSSVKQAAEKLAHKERIIFAYTLSPQEVIEKSEVHTPPLSMRLKAIKALQEMGFSVRLCFDPLLYMGEGFEETYKIFIDSIFDGQFLDIKKIRDISVGSFRISAEYLKNMRKNYPMSKIAQYPYICEEGFYQYPEKRRFTMETFVTACCEKYIGKDRIFLWRE